MADALADNQYRQHGLIGRTIENYHKLSADKKTKFMVEARLKQLESYWEKFEKNHEQMLTYVSVEDRKKNDYFRLGLYDVCAEDYVQAKADLLEILSTFATEPEQPERQERRAADTSSGRSKALPKITLPKFSGEYKDWIPFRDLFLSLVGSSQDLSNVEKLHYLKSSVYDDAAKLIGNIPITDDNYERAWNKIVARFENERVLINAQLDILFNLKSVQRKCAKELETLKTTVAEVVESLEALGGPVQYWDYFLVYICRRLDPDSHEAWELRLGGSTEPPKYSDLDAFLEARIRALENVDVGSSGGKNRTVNPGFSSDKHQFSRSHVAASTSCSCCGSAHFIASCPTYQRKLPNQRKEIISSKMLCLNCLGQHPLQRCHSSKRCWECGQKHHTSIHASLQPEDNGGTLNQRGRSQSAASQGPCGENRSGNGANSSAVHHATTPQTNPKSSQALLAAALVTVMSTTGRGVQARALLDQGLQLSFVCESLAQSLQLPRKHASRALVGIGDQRHTSTRGVTHLRFQNRDSSREYSVKAHILPRVTGRIPASPVLTQNWPHLNGLCLADPSFAVPAFIDLLLGADIYGHLLEEELRKGAPDDPVAQRTTLGWIVSGPTSSRIITIAELCLRRGYRTKRTG